MKKTELNHFLILKNHLNVKFNEKNLVPYEQPCIILSKSFYPSKNEAYKEIIANTKDMASYLVANLDTHSEKRLSPNGKTIKIKCVTKTNKSIKNIEKLIFVLINSLRLIESIDIKPKLPDCVIICSLTRALHILKSLLKKEELSLFIKNNRYSLFESYLSLSIWKRVNDTLGTQYSYTWASIKKTLQYYVPKLLKEIGIFMIHYVICRYFLISSIKQTVVLWAALKLIMPLFRSEHTRTGSVPMLSPATER